MSILLLISSGLFVIGMLADGIIYPLYKKKFIQKQEKEIEQEKKKKKKKMRKKLH